MPLVMPKETKSEFELPPAGTHVATCYRVVDLGTQITDWMGQTKSQHKILIGWEMPDEKMSDGRPFSMQKRYTLSSHEKATLRLHLEAWRGKAFTEEEFGSFDLGTLIGVSCLLNVKHTTKECKTYADIGGIMKLPKGTPSATLTNASVYFSLDNFEQSVFDSLSDGLRETIMKSPEYRKAKGIGTPAGSSEDDAMYEQYNSVPF